MKPWRRAAMTLNSEVEEELKGEEERREKKEF
jgi:hypothetical protein